MDNNTPLEPVAGSWDVEVGWKEGSTPEERKDAEGFILEASKEVNGGDAGVPGCIVSIMFRKI